jgi:MFS family permease
MPPAPAPDGLNALRDSRVRAFVLGRMASSLGAQFVSVAVGWELYERTGDPWALGLTGLFSVAPVVLLMVPAGNAADRYPRRDVAMLGYGLFALAALGLTLVSWSQAPVGLVYGLLVLVGAARAFASPSVDSLLPQLVSRRQLANAQAWLASGSQLATICGPPLAGLLIALFGAATLTYLAAAGAALLFVALLATIPPTAPPPATGRRRPRDLLAGLGFIRRSPVFLAAMTLDLFAVLLGGAVALLPVFAKDILMVGPAGLGVLRAAPAVGALLMALVIAHRPPWERPGRVLLLAVTGFGLATVGFGLSTSFVLSLACLFLVGAFDSISNVLRGTLQQIITPDHLRGRVAAVEKVFVGFSNELGALESGAVAALFGPVISVVSGGLGTLAVVGLVALAWPALARIGPLHTLHPPEQEAERLADRHVRPAAGWRPDPGEIRPGSPVRTATAGPPDAGARPS